MLFFLSASAENDVTFSQTLPDLHELSMCLWLLVEATYVGTMLSYATDENDNQLVLHGQAGRLVVVVVVVLGLEQDAVGGGFDPAEGFAGQVAGFRVWNRVLSPSEVEGVVEGRDAPRRVVLGMEGIKEVHGDVHQVACDHQLNL